MPVHSAEVENSVSMQHQMVEDDCLTQNNPVLLHDIYISKTSLDIYKEVVEEEAHEVEALLRPVCVMSCARSKKEWILSKKSLVRSKKEEEKWWRKNRFKCLSMNRAKVNMCYSIVKTC